MHMEVSGNEAEFIFLLPIWLYFNFDNNSYNHIAVSQRRVKMDTTANDFARIRKYSIFFVQIN